MPVFDFELLYNANLTSEQTQDEFEDLPSHYIDPYDPYFYIWVLAFTFELPEVDYVLEDEDEMFVDDMFDNSDVYDSEEFIILYDEEFNPEFYLHQFDEYKLKAKWTLIDETTIRLSLIYYLLKFTEEFTITFPFYWLQHQTFFDFADNTFNPVFLLDECTLIDIMPLLFFPDIPTYNEGMGDMDFIEPIFVDTFGSYPTLTLNLAFTSEILQNLPTTYTIMDTEYFPSFYSGAWSTSWFMADPYFPNYKVRFHTDFSQDPSIYAIDYTQKVSYTFDVAAWILSTFDTFDVDFQLVYSDGMGDIDTWNLRDEYYFPHKFKMYDRSAPPNELFFDEVIWDNWKFNILFLLKWNDVSTITESFDFANFDCRAYTVDLSCTPKKEFDFEEVNEINTIEYNLCTEDLNEISEDIYEMIYLSRSTDNFYDLENFYYGNTERFDFKEEFTLDMLVDSNEFSFLWETWSAYSEPEDIFYNEFNTYVIQDTETWSVVVNPTTYRVFTEDEFDYSTINLYEKIDISSTYGYVYISGWYIVNNQVVFNYISHSPATLLQLDITEGGFSIYDSVTSYKK